MGLIRAVDIRLPNADADSLTTIWGWIVSRELPAFLISTGVGAAYLQSTNMKGIEAGRFISTGEAGIESACSFDVPAGHVIPLHLLALSPLPDSFPLFQADAVGMIDEGTLLQEEAVPQTRTLSTKAFKRQFMHSMLSSLVVDRNDLGKVVDGEPVSKYAATWEGLAVRANPPNGKKNNPWALEIVRWLAAPVPPGSEPRVNRDAWAPAILRDEMRARSTFPIAARSIYDSIIKARATLYK